jgi:hypothetical protein
MGKAVFRLNIQTEALTMLLANQYPITEHNIGNALPRTMGNLIPK